jgi:hypothetical protein
MVLVLVCSERSLEEELAATVAGRGGVERRWATTTAESLELVKADQPGLILVDRDLPEAIRLVQSIRRDPLSRRTSVAIVAHSDFDPCEVDLLEFGANAVLRLPAGPEWDERLGRLIAVPARGEARFPVVLELEARDSSGIHSTLVMTINLSASGMLIESEYVLDIGDDLDLRFRLPDTGDVITGCARVMRQAGRSRFGIEFYGLEGDGQQLIDQFVARLANARS